MKHIVVYYFLTQLVDLWTVVSKKFGGDIGQSTLSKGLLSMILSAVTHTSTAIGDMTIKLWNNHLSKRVTDEYWQELR